MVRQPYAGLMVWIRLSVLSAGTLGCPPSRWTPSPLPTWKSDEQETAGGNNPQLYQSVWTPDLSSGPARSIFKALLFISTFALIRSPYPNSSVISVLCVASI